MASGSPVRLAGVAGRYLGLQGSHGLLQVPALPEKQACIKHLLMQQYSGLIAGLQQTIRINLIGTEPGCRLCKMGRGGSCAKAPIIVGAASGQTPCFTYT